MARCLPNMQEQGTDMIRLAVVVSLLVLVGCGADQSRGTALNECRMKTYLDSPSRHRAELIPDCMAGKSLRGPRMRNPATRRRRVGVASQSIRLRQSAVLPTDWFDSLGGYFSVAHVNADSALRRRRLDSHFPSPAR